MNGIDEIFLEPVFYGGEISTIMGGAKLDLRRTTLPEGDTTLKISSICGGVTLLLPLDWNVKVNSDSILGGFGDHRRTNGVNNDRRLIIDASFILGGGSIE
jgi:Predicted membrane protein